jgi:hypothetical protein
MLLLSSAPLCSGEKVNAENISALPHLYIEAHSADNRRGIAAHRRPSALGIMDKDEFDNGRKPEEDCRRKENHESLSASSRYRGPSLLRTTLRAPSFAAVPNVSYALMMSFIAKR